MIRRNVTNGSTAGEARGVRIVRPPGRGYNGQAPRTLHLMIHLPMQDQWSAPDIDADGPVRANAAKCGMTALNICSVLRRAPTSLLHRRTLGRHRAAQSVRLLSLKS
jgi:hypothetical protein